MNASGTAVPPADAASAPFSAIAAVGAIIATEIPAVSTSPNDRRSVDTALTEQGRVEVE
jgi:hypothetical protein